MTVARPYYCAFKLPLGVVGCLLLGCAANLVATPIRAQERNEKFEDIAEAIGGEAAADKKAEPLKGDALRAKISDKLSKIMQAREATFLRYMNIKVAELQRECDLDEQQVRKLQVGAKGAVERFVVKWNDVTVDWVLQMIGGNRGQNQDAMIDQFAQEQMFSQYDMAIGAGIVTRAVTREPIWNKMLEKTLTPQQQTVCAAIDERRETAHRELTISYLIMQLDQEHMLSPQQQKALRPLVNETISVPKMAAYQGTTMGGFWLSVKLYQMPKNKVAKVLNAEQMKIWDEKLKKYSVYFQMDESQMLGPWSELLSGVASPKAKRAVLGIAAAADEAAADAGEEVKP